MANPSNAKHVPTFHPENFTDPGSQRKQWGQLTREPGGQSQGSTGADTAGPRRCPSGCYSQGPDFSGFYFYQEQMLYLDSTRRSGRNSSACKETPTKTPLSSFSAFCIFFCKTALLKYNNWCFQTVVLEKALEGPLDSKIKPVNPKGSHPEYSLVMLKLKLQYFDHLM